MEVSDARWLAAVAREDPVVAQGERDRSANVLATAFPSILVLSDLHLGPGMDKVTGRWARTENFFSDDAFRRALRWYRESAL
jgi:hypothetical protein